MLELLAPAASLEGVKAAVTNGADAVYMGFGNFNARRNAVNFTDEEFKAAAQYCRVRGVKVYVTLNTLISDREIPDAVEVARKAHRMGADAVLVQDLGLLKAIKQCIPNLPVHASTQMSVHNLEGVKMAAAMGITRVVLARELSFADISKICHESPVEIEVFAHGALCMCYSGQCYMSSVIGRRSGNRGRCAQPCRLKYSSMGKNASDYPLSLKDNCLVNYLKELEKAGVSCVKIEGRMRRPEYAAIVTGIYSKAIRSGENPSAEEMRLLENTFSRQGFTDAYYRGTKGPEMLGIREDSNKTEYPFFSTVRKNYANNEFKHVPVQFAALVKSDEPVKLAVKDVDGNTAVTTGPVPDIAFNKGITQELLKTQLQKTGGTPFECIDVKSSIEDGLSIPVSAINEMRRTLLSELMEKRKYLPPKIDYPFTEDYKMVNSQERPALTISVTKASQLSKKLADLAPQVVYVPLTEFTLGIKHIEPFLQNPNITVSVIIPRIIHDDELPEIESMLKKVKQHGVNDALVGNIGHIMFVRQLGFNVRGDYGLNVYNSQTLKVLKDMGLISATLSFELRMEQIKAISKHISSELIVYGRLPLMITENCIMKNSTGICSCDNFPGIVDRQGFTFPIIKEFGCRNTILNSKKLFLADKARDYVTSGLWGVRLMFTKENPSECVSVTERYLNLGTFEPTEFTRGLYYRGVE